MAIAKLLEQVRLRAHFRQVIGELRARDVSHLAPPERAMRERLVLELVRYARAGRFPQNHNFAQHTPYFVDANGTRCAMAHLIESTGERDYVDDVRRTRNNAYVRELAADIALQRWLRTAGLSAAEAARIQPAYCFVTKADSCFCNQTSTADGVVIARATAQEMDGVVAMVESVHGATGGIVVGQSITVGTESGAHPGDTLLVSVGMNNGMPFFQSSFRLDGDEVILNNCEFDVPQLTKADAIAALTATGQDSCSTYLANKSSTWGESQCEEENMEDQGGCLSVTGDSSPLVIGAALAAALFVRRRAA